MNTLFDEMASSMEMLTPPAYDVKLDDDNRYSLSINALGFSRDEIEINANTQELTIVGNIKSDVPDFITRKRFKRSFEIENLDQESINAKMENGILTIMFKQKVPKEKELKKIKID